MNNKTLLFAGLLLASGTATAQYRLDTVTVRAHPDGGAALSMHCDALYEPNRTDLESVLQIRDPSQTRQLRQKFMVAVAEACNAGAPVIVVERGKDGQSLTWTPVGGYPDYTTTTTTYGPEYPADTEVYQDY